MADIKYADQTYIEAYFTEILTNLKSWIDSDKNIALKKVLLKNNSLLFYKNPNAVDTDTAEYSIDLPIEKHLDLSLTEIVSEYSWTEELYPNSDNPNLDGKPVLVLAVRGVMEGEDGSDTITYKFLDMECVTNKLVNEINQLTEYCQQLEERISALESLMSKSNL